MQKKMTPTLLLILDGWGQAMPSAGNAVSLAKTPTLDKLLKNRACTLLACSGREVGLPKGFMGNSEVGHLNIGAGRVVNQDITRIDLSIEDGTFGSIPVIAKSMAVAKENNSTLHLLGLLSDGGVHSHINHLISFLKIAKEQNIKVAIHAITDGRDTGPQTGINFIREIFPYCTGNIRLASIMGRYFAMDRDKRWERVALAWDALVHGKGKISSDPVRAFEEAYAEGQTDEFIKPVLFACEGQPPSAIADKDTLFFLNFRADRARELCQCFCAENFAGFDIGKRPKLSFFGTMTRYEKSFIMPVAFDSHDINDTLGETISKLGLKQLRIAETEKYAHVTYFFNGGREEPFEGEERVLVSSPRDVPTYDLKPAMSAEEVTDKLLAAINSGNYGFIVCNLANLDMVGHTGNIPAAVKACEVVDACTQTILEAASKKQWRVFVTADHGNAEEMLTPEGEVQTAHSKNPVAFIMIEGQNDYTLKNGGKLGDIAPTILDAFGFEKPLAMTGLSLLERK